MRRRTDIICLGVAMVILAPGLSASAEERTPCLKIKQVCEDAGFKQGGLAEGLGLQVDCIRPIMEGTPQRQRAAKPLPTIDAAVVAACKARNPKFGVRVNDPPDQPTGGSDF